MQTFASQKILSQRYADDIIFKIGTDLAANYASALAGASILFRDSNATYAAACLSTARQLYNFADKYRGIYSDSVPDAADNYG